MKEKVTPSMAPVFSLKYTSSAVLDSSDMDTDRVWPSSLSMSPRAVPATSEKTSRSQC